MDGKLHFLTLLMTIHIYGTFGATLRRTPKVYNALITTDENLTSSQAYPVIQPTIHETGLPHYHPFGPYNNPYGYYNPSLVRFGQPIIPGLKPREQLPFPLMQNRFPPQLMPHPQNQYPPNFPGQPFPGTLPTSPAAEQTPLVPVDQQQPQHTGPKEQQKPMQQPTTDPQSQAPSNMIPFKEIRPLGQQMPNEILPIELNEHGFPPALIPLQQYGNRRHHPINLSPYGYNQYPLIYDPVNGFREQYLPPYEFYPSHSFSAGGVMQPKPHPQAIPAPNPPATVAPLPEEDATPTDDDMTTAVTPSFESIKNGSKSDDSDVPDVPPPPPPSGAKGGQS